MMRPHLAEPPGGGQAAEDDGDQQAENALLSTLAFVDR